MLCYEDIIVSSILYVIAGLVPVDVSCVSLASPLSTKSTGGLNHQIRLVQLSTMYAVLKVTKKSVTTVSECEIAGAAFTALEYLQQDVIP